MPPKTVTLRRRLAEKEEELKRLEDRLKLFELQQQSDQAVGEMSDNEEEVKVRPQQPKKSISRTELALIGKFSGYGATTEFIEWSEKLVLVMQDNEMTDSEKKRTIPLLLAGGAYNYYSSLPNAKKATFEGIMSELSLRYGRTDDQIWRATAELNARKWNIGKETIEQFAEDIDRLISQTNKSSREKLEAVMRGLPVDVQKQVMCHRPATVEAILEYARILAPTTGPMTTTQPSVASASVSTELQTLIQNEIKAAVARYMPRQEQNKGNRYHANNNTNGNDSSHSARSNNHAGYIKNCQRCGKSHSKNACYAFGATCRGCGRRGHFVAYCRSGGVGSQPSAGASSRSGESSRQ